ncbi:MAG: aminoglycoside phosphotransferase, partial [Bacteroidales bacterium]|nr:aminoglycoside phosphotransferase [Bacteroidales bacterium]
GPGILFYDYGDALRTSANTAAEDEKNLSKVQFNLNAFSAFTSGYIENIKNIMSTKEAELFYKAPVLMTYIIGIRFLTDYLNGDIYYKTAYPEHNLTRALVQKALIESMESNEEKMKHIISEAIYSESEKSKSV